VCCHLFDASTFSFSVFVSLHTDLNLSSVLRFRCWLASSSTFSTPLCLYFLSFVQFLFYTRIFPCPCFSSFLLHTSETVCVFTSESVLCAIRSRCWLASSSTSSTPLLFLFLLFLLFLSFVQLLFNTSLANLSLSSVYVLLVLDASWRVPRPPRRPYSFFFFFFSIFRSTPFLF